MNINWFPGHMKKTRDLIQNNLKLVDVVVELIDARIPLSSRNPEIDAIVGNKPRLIVLNKCDLSNEGVNNKWKEYFQEKGINTVFVNAVRNKGTRKIVEEINEITREKRERLLARGVKNKTTRIMIVGIPNVGKSTLINALARKKSAKTGDRPGVTKSKQWIKLSKELELLDTPGILWPKFEDQEVALNLAYTGAIKDEIMDIETLAFKLIEKLVEIAPNKLEERYKVEIEGKETLEIMDEIALKRGCIRRGREIDYSRIASIILDEFRDGTIGNISLEDPFKEDTSVEEPTK